MPILLAGSSHSQLAQDVSKALKVELGKVHLAHFPDGELDVAVDEEVRGREVFILQGLHAPAGEYLLELALLADACQRKGATSVTAVIPYLGYARQDRRDKGREPLGARVVAEMLKAGRINRSICLDLHSRAVEGCFPLPVEHANAVPLLIESVRTNLQPNTVVVSPDLGAVKRAESFARPLGLPVAVVHKQRLSGSNVEARGIVGNVKDMNIIVVDDMISTGGTLEAAVMAVLEAGAKTGVTVVASHGLFVGPAAERLSKLPLFKVVTTDSVPLHALASGNPFPLLRVSVAETLAQSIRGLMTDGKSKRSS
jgi:ribose-phosphate pyrophosphokinase